MKTVIVIPARYGSTRLPGKPLKEIAGISMVRRMWHIAKAVTGVSDVLVATDDERIITHVEAFGGRAVLTGECENGTERAWQAIKHLNYQPDNVVNLQGDAVLTPPWVVQAVVNELNSKNNADIVTPAVQLTPEVYAKFKAAKNAGEVGGTTVAIDNKGFALYFSKSVIPFIRKMPTDGTLPVYRHIGLYGYRYHALERYLSLPPGKLELVESLEQLRALENGMPVKVVVVDYQGRTHWAVDSAEDAKRAEEIIAAEGELV